MCRSLSPGDNNGSMQVQSRVELFQLHETVTQYVKCAGRGGFVATPQIL